LRRVIVCATGDISAWRCPTKKTRAFVPVYASLLLRTTFSPSRRSSGFWRRLLLCRCAEDQVLLTPAYLRYRESSRGFLLYFAAACYTTTIARYGLYRIPTCYRPLRLLVLADLKQRGCRWVY